MRRDREALVEPLDLTKLACVSAGADSFGRCGPGSSWTWLGNVYTPECKAHDAAVRSQLDHGTSPWLAHTRALPLLPAAIGSYFRARLSGH